MNLYIVPAWYPQHDGDITASFFREQAHALAARGHRVTVIHIEPVSVSRVFSKKWHETRTWQDGRVRTMFHKVIVPVPGKFSAWQDSYISNLFCKILKKQIESDKREGLGAPDLLHAHVSHSCAYYCLKAAKTLSLPLVVTEHYSGLLLGTASEKEYARVKATIEQSDAFIYVGERFQHTLDEKLGIQQPTYAVPNLFDSEAFEVRKREEDKPFTFLTACHLTANKRVDAVVRALHNGFSASDNVRLTVAGDGAEMPKLKALVAELSEEDRVSFFGRYAREQAKDLFGGADAFVLVSKVETFGIVFLEALASGVPCVGTKGQGADDILNDSNGFTVTCEDEGELIGAMRALYENREKYDPVQLRQDCVERFGEDAICTQIEAIYKRVLKA